MEITTQLALFLANKPGTLAAVCDALAEEKINIFGLTISDTVDHAVVRMVVSDHKRALSIFEEHGTLVLENEVLMLEHDNKPGTLSQIAKKRFEVEKTIVRVMDPARASWYGEQGLHTISPTKHAIEMFQRALEPDPEPEPV